MTNIVDELEQDHIHMRLSGGIRLTLGILGITLMGWALQDAQFRDAEGFFSGRLCVPLAAGLAALIFGLAFGTRLTRTAFWFSVALVGQAGALQLIDAGPALHYQHYRSIGELLTFPYLPFLILIVAQAMLAALALTTYIKAVRYWLFRVFGKWQLWGFALVFVLSAAAVSRDIGSYLIELPFATFVQATNLATIIVMVMSLPSDLIGDVRARLGQMTSGLPTTGGSEIGRVDRFAVVAAVWVFLLSALLAVLAYEQQPHISDEVAYLYHARFLAEGQLTLPAPPVADAFEFYLMDFKADQWYASTPPGWPLMLALGVRLGVPWLVNPALAGLSILLIYVLVTELYDRHLARMTVLLLSLSPWFVFMGMNFMTHMFSLACALLAAVAVARARRNGRIRWGWLAGAAVGMSTLIRPLDGLIVGALIGAWAIGLGGRRLRLPILSAFVAGAAIVGALVLPYNALLTGSPTTFPINAYVDKQFGPGKNDLGFGPDRGFGWALQPFPGHSPLGAMVNANLNTFSINTEMFGWSTGSLLFVAFIFFSTSLRKADLVMLSVCAAVFTAYFFYYYSGGPDFGARYWFLMVVPCAVLTVRGMQLLQARLSAGVAGGSVHATRVTIAVLALSLMALANYFPWRAIDKYHHLWGMRPDVAALAQQYHFGRSLILVRGPEAFPDYMSAAIYNPLDFHADAPIYAWDRGADVRARLLAYYADRPVWVLEGPSITHAGFRIIQGPVSPQNVALR